MTLLTLRYYFAEHMARAETMTGSGVVRSLSYKVQELFGPFCQGACADAGPCANGYGACMPVHKHVRSQCCPGASADAGPCASGYCA